MLKKPGPKPKKYAAYRRRVEVDRRGDAHRLGRLDSDETPALRADERKLLAAKAKIQKQRTLANLRASVDKIEAAFDELDLSRYDYGEEMAYLSARIKRLEDQNELLTNEIRKYSQLYEKAMLTLAQIEMAADMLMESSVSVLNELRGNILTIWTSVMDIAVPVKLRTAIALGKKK